MGARSFISKVDRLQQTLSQNHIPDLVVYGVAMFSALLGVIFITTADRFEAAATFERTFQLAQPQVWGILFILTSIFLAVGFWRDKNSGMQPALVLTILYTVFAFTATINPFEGEGVFSAGVVYSMAAYFSVVAALCCNIRSQKGL